MHIYTHPSIYVMKGWMFSLGTLVIPIKADTKSYSYIRFMIYKIDRSIVAKPYADLFKTSLVKSKCKMMQTIE